MIISVRTTFLAFCILLFTLQVCAQNQTITVKLVDNITEDGIENAKVFFEDSLITETNQLGYFQLIVSTGDTIFISVENYIDQYFIIPNEDKFQIGLDRELFNLEFSEGMHSFYKQLASNIKYPKSARKRNRSAIVYVELIVNEKGETKLIKVHHDHNGYFEEVIAKVINDLNGNWNVKYKDTTFLLPVWFLLEGKKIPSMGDLDEITYNRLFNKIVLNSFAISR